MTMRTKRRIRNWKEKFNQIGPFVWSRSILFNGVRTVPGVEIPKELADDLNKLKRFWNSHNIRLKLFVAPDVATGQVKMETIPCG